MKYLLRSINLLNVLLLTAAVLWAYYAVLPLLKADISYSLPEGRKTTGGDRLELPDKEDTSLTDYMIIAEQNLFHPERTLPVEKKEEKPLPKPEITLYGTITSSDVNLAYIEDKNSPLTTPGRGKRVRVAKKGDEVSGFVLREISSDKIVLFRGEEKMVVNLTSPSKRREAVSPPTQPKPKPQS